MSTSTQTHPCRFYLGQNGHRSGQVDDEYPAKWRTRGDLKRRTRRRFSGAEKQRLLSEYDLLGHGERVPWLRCRAAYVAEQLVELHNKVLSLADQMVEGLEHREVGIANAALNATVGRRLPGR